jgi:hypothetical protein
MPVPKWKLAGLGLMLAGLAAPAQDMKVGGDLQIWYDQMLNGNLRSNATSLGTAVGGRSYYNLRSEYKENGLTLRRAEISVTGKILEGVEFAALIDPSINTSTSNPSILQDAYILYKPVKNLEFKIGQFKDQQTYEAILVSVTELLFAERSQMGRYIGDIRDRGMTASYLVGDPKAWSLRGVLGVFAGGSATVKTASTATTTGITKASDANAQRDFTFRLDATWGATQKFGVYTLQGTTDYADKLSAPLAARAFTAADASRKPSDAAILANKDKTTSLGCYYAYQDAHWHFSAEYITGLLGRRFPSVENVSGTTADAALREHLDQKLTSAYVTGGYTVGAHSFLARYDLMNFNSGNDWYTAHNPYTTKTDGTPLTVNGAAVDYTPRYTELTLGYTYAFNPAKVKSANIKVNYIARSRNFLTPVPGQSGAQGGDTLMVAFQVAF